MSAITEQSPAAARASLADARVGYLILYVHDIPESRDFYERRLGLRVIEADEESVKLDAGLVILALHRAADYGISLAGRRDDAADTVFLVDDINAARLALEARGVVFTIRRTYEVGLVTDFYDPNGHRLMLYQPSEVAMSWPSAPKLRDIWRACGRGGSEVIGPPAGPPPVGGRRDGPPGLAGKPLAYLFLWVPESHDAIAFYAGALGLREIERVHCDNPACPREEKSIAKYDVGGLLLGTHHVHRNPVVKEFGKIYTPTPVDPANTKGIAPVFLVRDIHTLVEGLAHRGVHFTQEVVRSQIGNVARFEAPTGHGFYLYEPWSQVLRWPSGAKIEQILNA
jgi:catechol 2,3-dioxygenase-like lactoylglutathione lyase family enzyme